MNWRGKNRTIRKPTVWTTTKEFYFGGKLVPAGVEVKQFETRNFGWTVWEKDGRKYLARE